MCSFSLPLGLCGTTPGKTSAKTPKMKHFAHFAFGPVTLGSGCVMYGPIPTPAVLESLCWGANRRPSRALTVQTHQVLEHFGLIFFIFIFISFSFKPH